MSTLAKAVLILSACELGLWVLVYLSFWFWRGFLSGFLAGFLNAVRHHGR